MMSKYFFPRVVMKMMTTMRLALISAKEQKHNSPLVWTPRSAPTTSTRTTAWWPNPRRYRKWSSKHTSGNLCCKACCSVGTQKWDPGGCFKNTYELLKLKALKFLPVNKIYISQCMGKIFCVEFQRYPLKFHTKHLTYTLKDMIFIQHLFSVFQITASLSARSRQLWSRTRNFSYNFLQFYVYDVRFKAGGLTTFLTEFWTLLFCKVAYDFYHFL